MPAEIAEPPTRETVNPALRALFDVEAPAEYTVSTTAENGEETVVPAAKAPAKEAPTPPAPAPEEKKPDVAKDDLKLRLAPDFDDKKPDAVPEPSAELAELNQAIKDAPTEKARIDLTKFRDKLELQEREIATLRSRPTPAPDDASTKTLLETVTKERDEALARLEKTDLMNSPKFQRDHLAPRKKSFDAAVNIVKESGADVSALGRAFNLTGKAQAEALDEIRGEITSETMRGQFDLLVRDINSKTAEINEKLADSRKAAEEMKREETVQTHEQRQKIQKQFEALLGSAITDLKDNAGLEVLRKTGKPEFAWFDDQVDEIMAVAREVYLDSTPEKAAIASVLAASAGPFRSMWQAERASNKALRQEISELKGASPTMSAERKTPKGDNGKSDVDDIMSRLHAGAYRK